MNVDPCSHCFSSSCSMEVGMMQPAPVPPAHSGYGLTGEPSPLLPLPPLARIIPGGLGGAVIGCEIGPFSVGSALASPPPATHNATARSVKYCNVFSTQETENFSPVTFTPATD